MPESRQQAFQLLIQYLEAFRHTRKKVIFFDELPWLRSSRSGFLSSLEYSCNVWASKRTDILLVVCGSAASWMIENIVRNKGGLYNRITRRLAKN